MKKTIVLSLIWWKEQKKHTQYNKFAFSEF